MTNKTLESTKIRLYDGVKISSFDLVVLNTYKITNKTYHEKKRTDYNRKTDEKQDVKEHDN